MKIAVLSDIHGNHVALKRCLQYLKQQKIDAYCFLGDYVGELPGNREVIQMLRKLQKRKRCYFVKGNKEDYQLNGLGEERPEWDAYPSLVGMIRYGRSQLGEKELDFLRNMPLSMKVKLGDMEELMLCHASPEDNKRPMWSRKTGVDQELVDSIEQKYVLFGHTHRMHLCEEKGIKLWNTGSVGLQLNGTTKTEFLILHSAGTEWEPEVVSLDYNYEEVIRQMEANRLYEIAPYWTKITEQLLRGGYVCHGTVLKLAMELCFQETGECEWPVIPERFMATAYDRLIGVH